ncbi:MAG: O-antigen ligase family protein, partial [Pyrinomonadaceae bacterium]
ALPSALWILTGCLIFLAIVPYAGGDAWAEAAIIAAIFFLGVASSLRSCIVIEQRIRPLLLPVLTFALYSMVHGTLTILVQNQTLPPTAAIPFSFDPVASLWNAVKFTAAAVFLWHLSVAFRADKKDLIWILVSTGNFFAIVGIARFVLQASFPDIFGWFVLPQLSPGVGFGTFVNQNHFAFLMLMTLGLNLGLLLSRSIDNRLRPLLLLASIFSWAAIILTASRGGIVSSIAVIVVTVVSSFYGSRNKSESLVKRSQGVKVYFLLKSLAATFGLTGLLILGVVLIGQERVLHRFEVLPRQFDSIPDTVGFSRLEVWRAASKIVDEYTFYGVGFGGFRIAVSQYLDNSGAVTPKEAHNDYLELLASGGLIAALCGIWFLYALFHAARPRSSNPRSRFENAARTGTFGAFAGIAIHSSFDFGMQFAGNWLSLIALVYIMIHNEQVVTLEPESRSHPLLIASSLICMAVISLLFGYSRVQLSFNGSADCGQMWRIPYDAESLAANAEVCEKAGNLDVADADLEEAVRWRPKDHALWLKLGKIRQSQDRSADAESAYRRAIELAPAYADPRWELGVLLVAKGRVDDGFAELRLASQRDPRYFEMILELAWLQAKADAKGTIRLLTPLEGLGYEKVATFLFGKNEYASLVLLGCTGYPGYNDGQRDALVTKLFEKRQFLYASQIYDRECGGPSDKTKLIDGDFESASVRDGAGFGWRLGELIPTLRMGYDERTFAHGGRSFGFIFDGNAETSHVLLSQTVPIEHKRQYKFSFDHRSEKLTSGGVPVLQLIIRRPDGDSLLSEIELGADHGDWINYSSFIQADDKTEAIGIRVTRRPCGQALCPIYGRLWLDNFQFE